MSTASSGLNFALNTFTRVSNTVVSGSDILANVSGPDFRAFDFSAQVSGIGVLPLTTITGPTGTPFLPSQLILATTNSLPVNTAISSGTLTGAIDLGPDTQAQAANYCTIFNLQTTTDIRIMRMFVATPAGTGTTLLQTNGGAAAHVGVSLDGGVAAASQTLFSGTGSAITASGGSAGQERIVLVTGSTLTSGSQVVNFNILSHST